jgi:hypothetical protein
MPDHGNEILSASGLRMTTDADERDVRDADRDVTAQLRTESGFSAASIECGSGEQAQVGRAIVSEQAAEQSDVGESGEFRAADNSLIADTDPASGCA